MKTNDMANAARVSPADRESRELARPEGDRLPLLFQELALILGQGVSQDSADASTPKNHLVAAAGRILGPHLEAGLRELTDVLRRDVADRMAQLQQLERLTGSDPASSAHPRECFESLDASENPTIVEMPKLSEASRSLHPAFFDHESPIDLEGPAQNESPDGGDDWEPVSDEENDLSQEASASPEMSSSEADLFAIAELWRQGDEERALASCSQIIENDLADAPAYLLRGQMYARRRDYDLAIEDFSAAIAIRPDLARAHLRRGNLYLALGKLNLAREGYSTALALQPDLVEAHLRRALIGLKQKTWAEAIADADAVLQFQPDCSGALFIRGSASFQLGDAESALADFNRLLEWEPKNARAYNERGQVLASLGEHSEALADYTRAVRLNPQSTQARFNRALAFLEQGHRDLALTAFTQLIHLAPDHALAHYYRAQIHRDREEFEQALADCQRAVELQPRFETAGKLLQELQQLRAPVESPPPPASNVIERAAPLARRPLFPSRPMYEVVSVAERTPSPIRLPERPSPPAFRLAESATKSEATSASHQETTVAEGSGEKTAGTPAESKKENPRPRDPSAQPHLITLNCECGANSRVGIDRLNRKFHCRKCQRLFFIHPDGKLTAVPRPLTRKEKFKALAWKGLYLSPALALILLAFFGSWHGWRSLSAHAPSVLPNELEPRTELLIKGWINQDADLMQRLTVAAQEDRIDAWLRANPLPLSVDDVKASRAAVNKISIKSTVLKEDRDGVQLRLEVGIPGSQPMNLVQHWVKVGHAWFFQPFPPKRKSK